MDGCRITNVKVSLKTSPIILDNVRSKNDYIKHYKNYLVLKSKYTYVIFKTNKNSENHVNITKIPSIETIDDAISCLKLIVDFKVLSVTVDNIIATLKCFKYIDLVSVCEKKLFNQIKYNNETFPGLFVITDIGTAILFHKGNIVLVGCKNEKNLLSLAGIIKTTIQNATQ
jgi:TATA-box binding protein (TBP) (component of TFIID and TFIIIB)